MGRAAVRAGITAYLQGANVTGLTTVIPHPPKITGEGDFVAPEAFSGAGVFVHLGGQDERRIAAGGPTDGMKMRLYTVSLIAVFRGVDPKSENVGDDNDAFLDSLCSAIEANRTPPGVWQWGEGDTFGAPDIRVETDLPKTIRKQVTQIWNVLTVDAVELLST